MTTGNLELDEKLNNPSSPNYPKLNDVYLAVSENLEPRWYDLFLHLGINRELLDKCLEEYPFDNHSSLIKVIALWLQRDIPPPSWRALIDVLQNTLLEGNAAIQLKRKYCPELLNESEVQTADGADEKEDPSQFIDEENLEFTKLLSDIAHRLGSHSFNELVHYLLQIRCPDGTYLIDPQSIFEKKTPEDLMIPLVSANLCSPKDLDILIHVLRGLQREDLLSLIYTYIPKISVGAPHVHPISDNNKVIVIKVFLNAALKQLDLGIVSAVKHDLCSCFSIVSKPYLMQYIGWDQDPIILHFQLPTSCLPLIEKGIVHHVTELDGNGIDCVQLHISGSTFSYSVVST